MKLLYIFPHPDDESFGPAGGIHQQIKEGHQVFLLTLTKGGATRVRHGLGLTVKQMGEVREREMLNVKTTLGISEMTILDYEDGALARENPIALEEEIKRWLQFYKPDIVVTYPVHGGSGHHDHIALHHVIKRIFYERLPGLSFWKRLAFFTVIDTGKPMFLEGGVPRVTQSTAEDISVILTLDDQDIGAMKAALLCYETYQEVVRSTNVIDRIGNKIHFELADEKFEPALSSLTEQIANSSAMLTSA